MVDLLADTKQEDPNIKTGDREREKTMTAQKSVPGRAARISEFLGLQRSTVGVLAMVVLVGMGERMAERFLPIYMLALGGGVLAIGLLQAMDNLLSALYSFPGGYFSTASAPNGLYLYSTWWPWPDLRW